MNIEYNIAVVGEVDAAKSTFIGCMTKPIHDDGRGSARLEVLTLKHEKESGRTSSINTVMTRYGETNIRFLDLAGHERYLNTTMQGLTRYRPNLAVLLIAANRGVTSMTKEHFRVCLSLHIPIVICFSKIDITPEHVLKETIVTTKAMTKVKNFKIHTYPVKDDDTLHRAMTAFGTSPTQIIPMFKISNITRENLDKVQTFLGGLVMPTTDDGLVPFMKAHDMQKMFVVYKPYYVNGTGYVVFGVNRGARITVGDTLQLGPIMGQYHSFRVRSIRTALNEPAEFLEPDQSGCLATKFKNFQPTKQLLRRTVVTDKPHYATEILAVVVIFSHHSTITAGYTPYLHSGNVATSAKVVKLYQLDREDDTDPQTEIALMRTGSRGYIRFVFPVAQFVYPGEMIIFRENGTKGVGRIVSVK